MACARRGRTVGGPIHHDPTRRDPTPDGRDGHGPYPRGPDVDGPSSRGPAADGPVADRRADARLRSPDRGRTRCGTDRRNAADRTDDRVSDPAACGQPSCDPDPDLRYCCGRNHLRHRYGRVRHRGEDLRCRTGSRHPGCRHPGRPGSDRLHRNGHRHRCHRGRHHRRFASRRRCRRGRHHRRIARIRRIARRQVAVPYCPSPPHPCRTPSCAQSRPLRPAPPRPVGPPERCRGASEGVVLLCSTINSG